MAEDKSIECLCVKIGDARVGIPSDYVEEVFEAKLITRLPCSPDFIQGMVNVRGTVIPVLDLWEVAEPSAPIEKIVILNTLEGLVGILISELIDLIRFGSFKQSGSLPAILKEWEKLFPKTGGKEEEFFILQVNELIAFTLTQNTRQADA